MEALREGTDQPDNADWAFKENVALREAMEVTNKALKATRDANRELRFALRRYLDKYGEL